MRPPDSPLVPLTKSELTCPSCHMRHTETMPVDACIYYFECTGCGAMLRPTPGDCCVFCSYGSVPCPPMQLARAQGAAGRSCCGYSE
jgi:hypothetical protein